MYNFYTKGDAFGNLANCVENLFYFPYSIMFEGLCNLSGDDETLYILMPIMFPIQLKAPNQFFAS